MTPLSRRHFVLSSLLVGAIGPRLSIADAAYAAFDPPIAPDDPLADGTLLEIIPFIDEDSPNFGKLKGRGLRARLIVDLASLNSQTLITPNASFFVRTGCPESLDESKPWRVKVNGSAEGPSELSVKELIGELREMGVHLLECSGNGAPYGLMSAAVWSGCPVLEALESCGVKVDKGTRLRIGGYDDHTGSRHGRSSMGASWIFTHAQLHETGAFFATHMNGAALTPDHGHPVRLVVPGWYGCTCIKWVNEIAFVDEDAPSTSQMREFASRTHQRGVPKRASDFRHAEIDIAATAIRVEKWRVNGRILYRVVGIIWGGKHTTDALTIRLGKKGRTKPVERIEHKTCSTWTLWSHRWRPDATGRYTIRLRVDDPAIRTRRLDRNQYTRCVEIDEV